ncbi:uncharacterized protein N7483_012688 [Penicillium malachiteum]|uniref:uncharacterized protein n=1 Tax=Penicillium malachiteum TaxID=1324776 RepID=UPI0025472A37|nr:uncharacterized protein N7483_012688 [Penicillium malachiteum]KAJ5715507.1 hypothetical protein N7483_012688 [Penicillium malachiteum]
MHRSPLLHTFLFGLSAASQISQRDNSSDYDSQLNFRPESVSGLGDIYHWVGSYYNATALVEYTPYSGVAASANDTPYTCPNIRDKKYSFSFDSILGITETSEYNVGSNPVNLFFMGWPEDTAFNISAPIDDMAVNEWSFFSSEPVYTYNSTTSKAQTNFNLTLQDTENAPYNLSSKLTQYYGSESGISLNMTGCNSSETTRWSGYLIVDSIMKMDGYNWTYPNPSLDLQFDSNMANLTIEGYFEGTPIGNEDFNEDGLFVPGNIKISFLGVIDTYHSDVLVNDSSTPSWERSVGFNNNSANIGYNGIDSKTNDSNNFASSSKLPVVALSLILSVAAMLI